jgi:Outer membrane protein beta-barrel domain
MKASVARYLALVPLLASYCYSQAASPQTPRTTINEQSQVAQLTTSQDPQLSNETLLFALPITAGSGTGQTSGTSGKKSKSSDQPAWDWASGVSIGLGYASTSGTPGTGGLNLGAGWIWKQQFELATDMDFGSETTILGGINSKSTRQNYLFGGRYYINKAISKSGKFEPFGHLMYGVSHESVKTTEGIPVTSTINTGQTSWAWDFGGGVDYLLSSHWALRGRVDWLKTHFNTVAQSHFKWVAGFWYSFSSRKPLPKP